MYAYDTEKNQVISVKDDVINVYMIRGDKLYYEVVGEGIYEYSLTDETENPVVSTEEGFYKIYKTADKYIAQSPTAFCVYDENGKEIYRLDREECNDLMYVNDNRLVTFAVNEEARLKYTFVNNVQDSPEDWDRNSLVLE